MVNSKNVEVEKEEVLIDEDIDEVSVVQKDLPVTKAKVEESEETKKEMEKTESALIPYKNYKRTNSISTAQFAHNTRIVELLKEIDQDGNGELDEKELELALVKMVNMKKNCISAAQFEHNATLVDILNELDEDGNGELDEKELEIALGMILNQRKDNKKLKLLTKQLGYGLAVSIAANCLIGCIIMYFMWMQKDSFVGNNGEMVTSDGTPILVANTDFFVNENGISTSRKSSRKNMRQLMGESSDELMVKSGRKLAARRGDSMDWRLNSKHEECSYDDEECGEERRLRKLEKGEIHGQFDSLERDDNEEARISFSRGRRVRSRNLASEDYDPSENKADNEDTEITVGSTYRGSYRRRVRNLSREEDGVLNGVDEDCEYTLHKGDDKSALQWVCINEEDGGRRSLRSGRRDPILVDNDEEIVRDIMEKHGERRRNRRKLLEANLAEKLEKFHEQLTAEEEENRQLKDIEGEISDEEEERVSFYGMR